MAVWKEKLAGCEVKIHNTDHPPPHCHAFVMGRDLRITLDTFQVLNPPPHHIPTALRRALKKHQLDMLAAWEAVHIHPKGSDPTWDTQPGDRK